MTDCGESMNEIKKRDKLDGYMTVEAGIIVPIAFFIIVVTLYFIFYLYNHCVVTQSCYIAALRGSNLQNKSSSVVEEYVNKQLDTLLENQIYQYQIKYTSKVNPFQIEIKGESYITNRIKDFKLYEKDKLKSEKKVKVIRIDPVDFIRNCERL